MTRTLLSSIVLLATSGCLVGELGSGHAATEIREVPGAVAFQNATFIHSEIQIDAAGPFIEITCDDNLLDEIITEVRDGVLVVRTEIGANVVPRTRCEALVLLPEIRSLTSSGSGSTTLVDDADEITDIVGTGSGALRIEGLASGVEHIGSHGSGAVEVAALDGCAADIDHTGSGRVVVDDIRLCELVVLNTGSGRTLLSGQADAADITITGSGGFGDASFVTQTARLRGTGSGGFELTVTDEVEIDLSGSGGAQVHGDPAQRDVSESGSGRASFL